MSDRKEIREIRVDATVDNIRKVTEFVDRQLAEFGCPMKAQMQIDIAIDELFGNIVRYAYRSGIGPAVVQVEMAEEPLEIIITFIDSGVPFNPLAKDDPDVTLSAEGRETGGLGIYLVKKSMDDISYEYRDGRNILRIRKLP